MYLYANILPWFLVVRIVLNLSSIYLLLIVYTYMAFVIVCAKLDRVIP